MPVIERFSRGVPVLTSSTTSLIEVANGLGILVDPEDVSSIKNGLKKLAELKEDTAAAQARQQWAARFTHKEAARQFSELIDSNLAKKFNICKSMGHYIFRILFLCLISMPALAQKSISVRTFGAQPNDNGDDQPAFQQLLKRMEEQPGNYIVSIPKGVYHLDRPLSTTGLQKNIVFKGEPGTRIVIRGHGGGLLIAASAQATLLRPLMRNQTQAAIRMPGNLRVEAGDLVHIQSNSPF